MAEGTPVLRWSAYEREHIERSRDWFWALGIVALSVAAIAILLNDLLFGVVVIAAAVTIALVARTPPAIAHFELSERGLRVDGELHRFDEIISFWVADEHESKPLLLIDTIKFLAPNLIIPIEHIDPATIRTFLKEHAEEVPMKEPLSHKILEGLGL